MSTPLNNSVIKAFHLLSAFKQERDGLSLKEATDRAGMTMPTAHRFLRTLLSLGALDQTTEGRYVIGSALGEFTQLPEEADLPTAIINRHVRQLAATLRETVHIAVLSGSMIRYIAKAETERSLKIVTQIGTTLEAYCTGVGKVLLAHQSQEYLQRYLASGDFVALTPRTITDRELFLEELEKVRECGFAVDDEEFESGLRCIATPLVVGGKVVAALSGSAPVGRLTDEAVPMFVAAIARRARMISSELDHKGHLHL